ncbi:TonB-dependent receptor [Oceanicola sp. 22II-s10i]|uniref:TonB-dependent receptor plug domain-containing protein n=1 Tax=Oceanicola sp. 22II-s10i TaxID=1317116 RepID=UPI000B52235A|nr:TonB-dependent receptor [Oceanicola sp. 22II-s10i]OWU85634.1 TonB-dependent receptor [Oceanicola sp. 22II-s10i]
MKTRIPAAVAAACAVAAPVHAQESFTLDPIIVSGGLTPIEAARYGRSVSVVTARDIEERGIRSVQDALRAVPGVAVNSNGHSFTQVRIRGGEANHTLILIDGVEAAGGDSEYILTGLETANIERIEVLRGPQSVFYGSDASAGVINIITKKGSGGVQYGATAEYGAGWSASGFVAVRDDRGGLSFGLTRRDDEGWDYSGSGGEKDGIDRWTMTLAGDYEVVDGLTLGFTWRMSEEHYDADGTDWTATTPQGYVVDDPTQFSDRDEQTMQVYAEFERPDSRVSGRLAFARTENTQSYSGGAPTETVGETAKLRLSYGLDGPVTSGNHVVNLLAEHERDSSTTNPLYKRKNNSIALEYRGSFGNGLDLQLGGRFDDNSVFGDSVTWTAAASYTLQNGVRLHASAGTGVVNPSYFELYAAAFGYTGNPGLDPERNQSFDVGVEVPFAQGRGSVDVTLFRETLTDEITAVSTGPGTFSYVNQTGDSDRRGVEVAATFAATDTLDLRLGYTWLDADNPNGSIELRRPKHALTMGATLRTMGGRGTVSADARYIAGNYDTQNFGTFATAKLPDYWTVDLAATYDVTPNLMLNARVENLFDKDYSDSWGYASRGRTVYVGLSSNF